MYEVNDYLVSWTFAELDNLHASQQGTPFLLAVEQL
jgi:hypothetical protein